MDSDHANHNRTATSRKLDWLDALAVDPAVKSFAFKIGFCIMQHVNARTGKAMVSDETIADKTSLSRRHVRNGRKLLQARGWIEWRRTRTANIYKPLDTNVNSATDLLTLRRDGREQRRKKTALRNGQPSATLSQRDRQPSATLDRQPSAQQEWQPSADIHLRGTR